MLLQPAKESAVVGLKANVNPADSDTNVDAKLNVNVGWVAEGCSGIRQYAYRENVTYTPLFGLKEIGNSLSRRSKNDLERDGDGEHPVAPLDQIRPQGEKYRWHEAIVPWKDLDDEGVPEEEVV